MHHRIAIVAIALSFLIAPRGEAQEKYKFLALRNQKEGETMRETSNQIEKSRINVVDGKGVSFDFKNETKTTSHVYLLKVLKSAPNEGLPAAFEMTFEKAVTITNGTAKVSFLQGKKILVEKKADKYHYTFDDGKELTAEQEADLPHDFNKNRDKMPGPIGDSNFIPTRALQLNETWKIDYKDFGIDKNSDVMFDLDKAKATGKLARVYKKDGNQFGVIDVELDFPMKPKQIDSKGQSKMKQLGGNMTTKFTYDACIDGSSPSGAVTVIVGTQMQFSEEGLGLQATTTVENSSTTEWTRELLK